MKEFEVTITETLQKSITVEAATREEAQAKAYSTFASLLKGWNVGASKRKLGSRVKLNAFSGW